MGCNENCLAALFLLLGEEYVQVSECHLPSILTAKTMTVAKFYPMSRFRALHT